jgi:hypothetical protein
MMQKIAEVSGINEKINKTGIMSMMNLHPNAHKCDITILALFCTCSGF